MEADIAGFITIGLVTAFIAGQIFKTLRTLAAQKTVRDALSRGTQVTPEMLMDTERSASPGSNDMRNGMVLIALALAIVGFGLLQGSTDNLRGLAGIALFPLFVGAALLLRLRLAARPQGDA